MTAAGKTVVVLPAYNAAKTLEPVWREIPKERVDEILLVDDASSDETVQIARRLDLTILQHERNRGYGANQKTCYRAALEAGAKFIVMLHPDQQYDARMIGPALDILRFGNCEVVLGNRIRSRAEALRAGMPRVKYLANRGLTILENLLAGQNLGEWHSGFRAYTREVLEAVPFEHNSDDFVFDSQLLLQCVHFGFRIGDVPVPVRYFPEASSISLGRSISYALLTLWVFVQWHAHRLGIRRSGLFEKPIVMANKK